MRRFTRSTRTRTNVRDTDQLRDQFIRDLTLEATALMTQLTMQFGQNLQTQAAQYSQGIVPNNSANANTSGSAGSSDFNSISSVSQLLATGVRYLVSRPRTSRDSEETSRSQGADTQFRVSQSQAMAEAQAAINKGSRNL
ncbi:MAG: hypothetical protein V4735_01660 [Pseudomonadota bacterium]